MCVARGLCDDNVLVIRNCHKINYRYRYDTYSRIIPRNNACGLLSVQQRDIKIEQGLSIKNGKDKLVILKSCF